MSTLFIERLLLDCLGSIGAPYIEYKSTPISCTQMILMRGLLPNRFVHTLNLPTGVCMLTILIPAACTPESTGAKYSATVGLVCCLQENKQAIAKGTR